MESPDATCRTCGRRMPRPRHSDLARPARLYCSERCRRERPGPVDLALENALAALLHGRPQSASVCPSEAARLVRPEDWRAWMERTRRAARRMVARGEVEITQGGRVVDPSTAKGPIRVRRARRAPNAD